MLAALIATAAVMAAIVWWLASREKIQVRDWLVAGVLIVWAAGVGAKIYMDRSAHDSVAADPSFRLPEWSAAAVAEPRAAPTEAADESAVAAAPVASLIGGLESRLAAEPADEKGWVLLAQSYAFVGDADATERALQRAVALGADEQMLRERVNAARRAPQNHTWIEQTVAGPE
jgi:cytochrome c-type biogenesis protein CcmH/NrfG